MLGDNRDNSSDSRIYSAGECHRSRGHDLPFHRCRWQRRAARHSSRADRHGGAIA
ncbi:hypothetical protein [Bradyrhizobium sp. 190]|uniref:hypothetical protein n=1 Tax=Bradyrhizobium sp. 190 TaxID=2782658 RepID=UPI0035ABDF40